MLIDQNVVNTAQNFLTITKIRNILGWGTDTEWETTLTPRHHSCRTKHVTQVNNDMKWCQEFSLTVDLHCSGPSITLSSSQNTVKAVLTLNSTTIFYCHVNLCHIWLSHKPFTVISEGSWLWCVTTTRTINSDIVHHLEYFKP
jgi:hypothetical protein